MRRILTLISASSQLYSDGNGSETCQVQTEIKRALIIEDDPTSRLLLQEYLKSYGQVDVAANGREAVDNVSAALAAEKPYSLICLDIMMPGLDGHETLREIRALEAEQGIWATYRARVVMTTSLLSDEKNTGAAYRSLCDAYLAKPLDKAKLFGILRQLNLIT